MGSHHRDPDRHQLAHQGGRRLPCHQRQDGEIVRHVPLNNFYRLLRSRFRAFMAEDIDVTWGKKLVDVSYSSDPEEEVDGHSTVTAHFADGTSATGRLLLGADSSNSRVRALLLGPERARLHRLSIAATFIDCSFTREQALYLRRTHPLVNLIVHPDGMMGMLAALDCTDASRPETWRFAFYISWRTSAAEQDAEAASGQWGPRERLAQAKEKSLAFADPMRSAYAWMPDDLETVYYTPNGNWDPSMPDHKWDNHGGCITLVGDSAHPMTYHRGQGLNHAIDDAGHIVKLLAKQGNRPLSAVIGEYEAEMRPRAGEEVRLSEMNSYMLHDWDKLSHSPFMTANLTKGTPKSFAAPSTPANGEDSTTTSNGEDHS
ncbi:fad nad-binding domain-containing protein [Apiospora hydei]|uniref:Fad nad-binding domain-containing protein n=1 Tax=Apiospora hydei TaxID=1337664 RepID=A0ABR1V3B9_9PEZI